MNIAEFSLSGSALLQVMKAVLEKKAAFRFCAKGNSMSPFIRNGDIITIIHYGTATCENGDIVAFVSPLSGNIVVHRIISLKNDTVYCKGDNCSTADGWIEKSNIVGKVDKIERQGKEIVLGLSKGKHVLSLLSRTRILNTIFLPVLRRIPACFRKNRPLL